MPHILITRPRPSSETLAALLKDCGYASTIEPLIAISPTHAPFPDLANIQGILLTSGNALPPLTFYPEHQQSLLDIPCYCVGPGTAAKARAYGFKHVSSSSHDGAELAELILKQRFGKGQPLLHLAGRDISSLAQDILIHNGYTVVSWALYQADPVHELSPATIKQLTSHQLDAVLVFSVRTAETLKCLLLKSKLEAYCHNMIAIGLSEAIISVISPLPWRGIVAAPHPNEQSMILCLQQHCPAS